MLLILTESRKKKTLSRLNYSSPLGNAKMACHLGKDIENKFFNFPYKILAQFPIHIYHKL